MKLMYIMLGKYINIPVFVVSLAIGIFAVYILEPETRKIFIYPSPDNVKKMQYKDKADGCYEYEQTEINCADASGEIKEIPPQY